MRSALQKEKEIQSIRIETKNQVSFLTPKQQFTDLDLIRRIHGIGYTVKRLKRFD